jgi:hypothetical protein
LALGKIQGNSPAMFNSPGMPKFSMLLEFTKLGRDGCPAVPRGGKPSERCWQDYLKGAPERFIRFQSFLHHERQKTYAILPRSNEAQALFRVKIISESLKAVALSLWIFADFAVSVTSNGRSCHLVMSNMGNTIV